MSASNWRAWARVWAESARWPLNWAKPGILADQSAKAASQSASDLKRESRSQVSWGLTLLRGGRVPAAKDLPLEEGRDWGLDFAAFMTGRLNLGFFFVDFVEVEVLAMRNVVTRN